ncbi:twin-arginine translocation signal domain-containing protein [Acetobacter sp. AN02]|uniref:twin-arginine translocation signal domain-containing protein n=1 Tax=Acetobacter sp. AN02 TaxID=2894186 RepID=UPI00243450C2|nr:twin-arginine translocation signal domain-containing protein [Acetobacter sp. AN02]MDG6095442.1 twin-arginine translocation signal domain-containing protein [Acetobacter sp. AN02]
MALLRRDFLRTAACLAGAATLAACNVSTNGSVTTVTLDVDKIRNYASAGLNAAATVASVLSSIPGAQAWTAPLLAARTALSAALEAFSDAAGSSLTVSYDNADIKSRVDSILNDLQTISATVSASVTGLSSMLSASVENTELPRVLWRQNDPRGKKNS